MNSLFCPISLRPGEWVFRIILSIGLVPIIGNAATPALPDTLSKPDAGTEATVSVAYGKLPLSFEVNHGQTAKQVEFLSRGNGFSLFLTPKEAVLVLRAAWGEHEKAKLGRRQGTISKEADSKALKATHTKVLRMQLVGASSAPAVVGEEELPGKSNYLLGKDPKKWRTDISHYSRVLYKAVYPGIDLVYYGNQRQLEYDFIVAPGADLKNIRLAFEGADTLSLDKEGNFVLQVGKSKVVQHAPKVYQVIDGRRENITASYKLREENQVSFEVASYDVTRPLVIDPVLSYATYLGGSDQEVGRSIAVDTWGNAYVTGETSSLDFPLIEPSQLASGGGLDVFVTKINPAGDALVYSTYLGGSNYDHGVSIAVDSKGNAYVTGITQSIDFPTVKPLQPDYHGGIDTFVAKLNAAGSELIYATYLGGSDNDYGNGIAVDQQSNAYVTGESLSTDFPTVNSLQSPFGGDFVCFVAKLNADGDELVYSTYLGGSDLDMSIAIAVDSSGNAYVTGETQSFDFPTTNALQPGLQNAEGDVFVAKLNANASALVYSTFLGGSRHDRAYGIAVDPVGNAYVTGDTSSTDFPTVNPLQPMHGGPRFGSDAFLFKLNAEATELIYSSYLGGDGNDFGHGVSVDSVGNAYVAGHTESTDFPVVNALQDEVGGLYGDAFVSKFNVIGSAFIYSTLLGGSDYDNGFGFALDALGNAYVTGMTYSVDFPTTMESLQGDFGGGRSDAFVAKISDAPPSEQLALIEAESMSLSGGYVVEDNAAASGGQLIRRLDSGGQPATASSQFTGTVGNYGIAVSYFDESDGSSSLAFILNGQPLDQWIADEDPACRDCASPGESTLRSRIVARDVRLTTGDEITLQGTGDYYEYARFDKITVAPVISTTLEAEMMTLEGGYAVEANAAASGGQLIRRLDSGGYAATASTEFAGLAGAYDITVSYFDEYDGMSSLAFLLNGEMLDQWIADEDPLCRDCASPGASTLRTRLVAKELPLVPGDEIALQGTGEHYEYARFDKITLAPVGFTTLEAEMMTLDDGFVVEANTAASGGKIIRGNGPAASAPGKANAIFMGSKGTYDITVTYFDEYDGISSMAVFLNDQLLEQWLADENPACRDCASPNERTLRSRVVATGIELSPGDDVRLESTVNQYEYGRFDKIDFTLSLSP